MPMNLGQIGLGLGAQGNNSWFNAVEFQDLSAVADFNNDRYALPALGTELTVNGGFDTDTVWVKGTGWSITGGKAVKVAGVASLIRDGDTSRFASGSIYQVQFTVSGRTAGFFSLYLRSNAFGTAGLTNGTFTVYAVAGTSTVEGLSILSDVNFDGSIDDVSVKEVLLTRGGQTLGANLITNGDFSSGIAGWTVANSTLSAVSGALRVTSTVSGVASRAADFQLSGLTPGRRVRVIASRVGSGGSGSISYTVLQARLADNSAPVADSNYVAGPGSAFHILEFTATQTNHRIRLRWDGDASTDTTTYVDFDNVEVRELPATGAYPKRSATRDEWFAFTAVSTTERSYVGVDGLYKNNLTANALRFDWRNGKRQLRLEDARTNNIRNNSMIGAFAGTPGTIPTNWNTSTPIVGLTRSVVGTGVEFGLPYIDIRLAGTPDIASYYNIAFENGSTAGGGIAAASGQTWTLSYRARLVAGSTTNLTSVTANINENTSAGGFVVGGAGAGVSLDSSIKTVTYTRTLSGGGTVAIANPLLNISTVAGGVPVDITIRIYAPQMEQGSFASDPILTSGAAVTRAIETARFSPLLEAVMQRAAASVVVRGVMTRPSGNARILGLSTNRTLLNTPSSTQAQAFDGTNLVTKSDAPANWTLSPFGADVGFDSSGLSLTVNGGSVASGTYAASVSDRSTVYLARPGTILSTDTYAEGLYDFVGISPERLSDSTLQALAVAAV